MSTPLFATQYDELQVQINNDSLRERLESEKLKTQRLLEELRQVKTSNAAEIMRLKKGAEDCPRRIAHLCHPNRFTEQAQSGFGRRKPGSKTEIYAGNPPNQQSVSGEKEPERKGDVSIATGCNRHHCTSQKQAGKNSQEGERCKKKIAVSFTIVKNITAKTGERTLYIRIAKPDNDVLTKNASNTFPYENRELTYSIKNI